MEDIGKITVLDERIPAEEFVLLEQKQEKKEFLMERRKTEVEE